MKLIATICTWRDGVEALAACVGSLRGRADEVLIGDGAIENCGVPAWAACSTMPEHDIATEQGATWFPLPTVKLWASQGVKRQWLLELARERGADWVLAIDADEELHDPCGWLRPMLRQWPHIFCPLLFIGEKGGRRRIAFKLFRAAAVDHVARCYYFRERATGQVWEVAETQEGIPASWYESLPSISHHPERRRPARQAIRLGALEGREPAPPDARPWPLPSSYLPDALLSAENG